MSFRQTIPLVALLTLVPTGAAFAAYTDDGVAMSGGGAVPRQQSTTTFKLQGRAEVQEIHKDMQAWQASQMYRQGAYFLSFNDFGDAAECFKQAGDGIQDSVGGSKFLGEARYAEAQCRRMLKQNARAAQCYQAALEQFEQYDPRSPYLRDAQAFLDLINGTPPHQLQAKHIKLTAKAQTTASVPMQSLQPKLDFVDAHVNLKGHATRLEDGTKFAGLKDSAFFNGSKMYLEEPAAVDVSDKFVHDTLYKAFLGMTCLEMAALGGNYYTAPDMYKAFKANGKPIVTGATDDVWCPEVNLKLNGHEYNVPMNLPGMAKSTKNVLLVTDGLHVLALDPRTRDTWNLVPVFSKKGADFNWWKLTHRKDRITAIHTPATPASPFAR